MDNFNLKNMQLAYSAVYDQNLCESMEELGLIGDVDNVDNQFELWVEELLDEGHDLSDYTWDELYEGYKKLPIGKMVRQAARKSMEAGRSAAGLHPALRGEFDPEGDAKKKISKMMRVADRHSIIRGKGKVRAEGQAELNRRRGEMKEEYDVFDLILEHLLEEGYVDTLEQAEAIMANMSEEWIESIIEERAPGVKPYKPAPSMAEINAASKKKKASDGKTGYGPDEKFYKPEDRSIPNKDWLETAKKQKKTFGRPIGKYDPAQIKRGDIEKKFPENSPGANPKPKRVIPSRLDRSPKR